jgi:carbon storage regulator CsrA
MLVLGRNYGQEIIMTVGDETIIVKTIEMTGRQVKLGITASQNVKIDRKEIHDAIMETGFNPEANPVEPTVIRIGERLPGELMRRKPQ